MLTAVGTGPRWSSSAGWGSQSICVSCGQVWIWVLGCTGRLPAVGVSVNDIRYGGIHGPRYDGGAGIGVYSFATVGHETGPG